MPIELVNQITDRITNLAGLEAPKSKSEIKVLKKVLEVVTTNPDSRLNIYVGSCPDYSHNNGLYTHKALNSGVPLLSQVHARNDTPLLDVLDRHGVNFDYILMVADVEATDEHFARKFSNSCEDEFLDKCSRSVTETQQHLDDSLSYNTGSVRSSSFFTEFGRQRFMDTQAAYQSVLHQRYETDNSFRFRVSTDTIHRMEMYRAMYPEIFATRGSTAPGDRFLVDRTIRTMAQYLTLGRLIAECSPHSFIISHPTKNINMFNSRNRFGLPADGVQPQPTLPIFEMKTAVY